MAIVGPGKLRVLKGEEYLSMYQFHSKVAKHFSARYVVFIPITIQEEIQKNVWFQRWV